MASDPLSRCTAVPPRLFMTCWRDFGKEHQELDRNLSPLLKYRCSRRHKPQAT
jgi:hypothetical protein